MIQLSSSSLVQLKKMVVFWQGFSKACKKKIFQIHMPDCSQDVSSFTWQPFSSKNHSCQCRRNLTPNCQSDQNPVQTNKQNKFSEFFWHLKKPDPCVWPGCSWDVWLFTWQLFSRKSHSCQGRINLAPCYESAHTPDKQTNKLNLMRFFCI